jgi:hypothetical protein
VHGKDANQAERFIICEQANHDAVHEACQKHYFPGSRI